MKKAIDRIEIKNFEPIKTLKIETKNYMNPDLKGRDMRKAFDSDDYQVMIVAISFRPALISQSYVQCM